MVGLRDMFFDQAVQGAMEELFEMKQRAMEKVRVSIADRYTSYSQQSIVESLHLRLIEEHRYDDANVVAAVNASSLDRPRIPKKERVTIRRFG